MVVWEDDGRLYNKQVICVRKGQAFTKMCGSDTRHVVFSNCAHLPTTTTRRMLNRELVGKWVLWDGDYIGQFGQFGGEPLYWWNKECSDCIKKQCDTAEQAFAGEWKEPMVEVEE